MGVDDRVRSIVQALGLKLVLWNVDTNDWKTRNVSPQIQISRITQPIKNCIAGCSTKNPNHGGIILEHDYPTALAIPNVLDLMISTSLNLKTVSQCTGYDSYNDNWLGRVMGMTLSNRTLDSKGNL
jgi:peptidoglycan/xylan/chitin deacetylase (PgdA/CDA1 family)